MNAAHRLVWSKVHHMLVVVAENVRSHRKGGALGQKDRCRLLPPLSVLACLPLVAMGVLVLPGQTGQLWADSGVCVDYTLGTGMLGTASGTNAIACGQGAVASGTSSIAVGFGAYAPNENSLAFGTSAGTGATISTNNPGNIAIGANTGKNVGLATSASVSAGVQGNNLALGNNVGNTVTGLGNVAIGSNGTGNNVVNSWQNVAIGAGAGQNLAGGTAGTNSNVAIGTNAGRNVAGSQNVAIGPGAGNNIASGIWGTTSVGSGATASGGSSVAVGLSSLASTGESTAVGFKATATGGQALALGNWSLSSGVQSLAVGTSAAASGTSSLAMVHNSKASGAASIAIGDTSQATSYAAIAVGRMAASSGTNSISMGDLATATGTNDVMIGYQAGQLATATGGGNIGIGHAAMLEMGAASTHNTAVGQGAFQRSTGSNNIALGYLANQNVAGAINDTIAIGSSAQATADSSIAIGDGARATGVQSISIGTGNVVTGANSGAIGDPSIINGASSYSIGNNNTIGSTTTDAFAMGNNIYLGADAAGTDTASVSGAVALGNASSVTVKNGVALGSYSVANTDAGIAGYDPRTNAASTDTSPTWQSTLAAVSVGNGTTATRQITGVAAGMQDTDAVNVAQLYAVRSLVDNASQGWKIGNDATGTAAPTGTVSPGERVDFVSGDAGNTLVTVGDDASNGLSVITVNSARSPLQYTSTNIAAGGNAANFDQFTATNQVTLVGSGGHTDQGVTINNVAPAVLNDTSLQAVNGSQLYSLGTSTATAIGGTSAFDATSGTVSVGLNVGGNTYTSVQDALSAINSEAGVNNTVTAGTNITVAETTNADGSINYQVSTADDVSFNSVTINGGATLDATGINMNGGTITGLAAGEISATSTDAVNGSQLYAISQLPTILENEGMNFTANTGEFVHRDLGSSLAIRGEATTAGTYSGANLKTVTDSSTGAINLQMADAPVFTGTVSAPTYVATGGNPIVVSGNTGTINGLTNTTFDPDHYTSGQAATEDQLAQVSNTVNAGWSLTTNGGNPSQVGPGDSVDFNNTDGNIRIANTGNNVTFNLNPDLRVSSVTAGNTLINTNGLFIKGGPSVTRYGINAAGQKISHVADATDPADAVNLGQLDAVATRLGRAIDEVDDRATAGVASAMAAASIPQVTVPGSNMMGAGTGYFHGASALAVGYSTLSDNGRWVLRANMSVNSEDAAVSAGVGYQW